MLPKCFAESTFGFVGCRRLPKHSKPVAVRPRNRKCDHTTNNWRASRETEEENLTFALRIEHQSTLRAFNLIPGHWSACETSRPQLLRCKSRPKCVPQRKKIALETSKALRIKFPTNENNKKGKRITFFALFSGAC